MASQVEQLRTKFDGMSTVQQKQFIEKLRQQTQGTKNVEHKKLLSECIQKYNTAIKGDSPASNPAPKESVNTIDNLAQKASGIMGSVKNEINTSKTVANVKNSFKNEGNVMTPSICDKCGVMLPTNKKLCPGCLAPNKSFKPIDPISLVWAILGIVGRFPLWFIFGNFAPFSSIAYIIILTLTMLVVPVILSVVAIMLAKKKEKTNNTKIAFIVGLVGLGLNVLLLVSSMF